MMFKRLYFSISLSLFSLLSFSSAAPKDVWVKQFGTTDPDGAVSVTTDAKGNIYVAGWIGEILPGQKFLGKSDAFISKYDSNGNEIWTKQFGSTAYDEALSVATDSKGNVYVSGVADGVLPDQKSLGYRYEDAFIKKYDANGKELWTKQFSTIAWDTTNSVTTDPKGDIYVAGVTGGTRSGQKSLGKQDAYVRKYDTNGKELWTKQFGTNDFDSAFSVTTDPKGNIYVAGITDGAFPGQTSLGGLDSFIRKYDTNGTELWTKQFGTTEADYANSVTTDPSGNIYVVGDTDRTLPGQTSLGDQDAFIRKYDTNGKEIWTQQFGTSELDRADSVAVDPSGNVYVAGWTKGVLPGQTNLGGSDAFVRKYDSSGVELSTQQFGSTASDYVYSVATDLKGNVFVTGDTEGAFPGQTHLGWRDAFLYKFAP